MTHLSSSSFFSDFGLLLYLEELNREELIRFKSLLKNETLEPGSCRIPWSKVKKAKRKDLADLMSKYYPGEQAWEVALSIFGKMNLKDLCERAKAEINCEWYWRHTWGWEEGGASWSPLILWKGLGNEVQTILWYTSSMVLRYIWEFVGSFEEH